MTHEGQTSANLMAHEKMAAKTRGRSRHALGQRSRTAFVRSAVRDRALVIAGWVAVLGVVGGAWQFAAVHGLIDPVFTGIPTRIAGAFLKSIAGPPFTVDTVAGHGGFDRCCNCILSWDRMRLCAGTKRHMAADL